LDPKNVEKYLGKRLLVGITYKKHDGTLIEQKQLHGTIVRINDNEGIVLRLHGSDEEFRLPPHFESLEPAVSREYRLRSTGELVIDPDFVATWTVTKPRPS